MLERTYCINLLLENATSFTEKAKIHALTEAEQAVVNDRMVGSLYQSILNKKDIDFDNIPYSKGDIKRVPGYDNMIGTLETLRGLANKFGMTIPELNVIEDAIVNIRTQKNVFERGYALNNEFLKMYYNSLVYACIESTSLVLASYVEYVKTLNNIEFQLRKGKGVYGNLCITNLDKFNNSIKDGSFRQFIDSLLNRDKEQFIGKAVSFAKKAIKFATFIPLARQLIYYFYESRMNIAESLEQQREFLEMNRIRVESSSMDVQKRNKVLRKQQATADKLQRWAEKIKVNNQLAEKKANDELRNDNKGYTLNSVSGNNDDYLFL